MQVWLRWLLVLPAAASGYAFTWLLVCLLTSFLFDEPHGCVMIGRVIGGFIFVWSGANTAPKFRFGISVVLAIGHWTLINILMPSTDQNLLTISWQQESSRILSISASLIAAYCVYRKMSEGSPEPSLPVSTLQTEIAIPTGFETDSQIWHATTVHLHRR